MITATDKVAAEDKTSKGPKNPLDDLPAERYGITIDFPNPLLQKHIEQFQTAMQKRTKGEDLAAAVIRGFSAKIGIELGWVQGLDVADVPNLSAGKVSWIYAVIAHHVAKAQEVPPN